jgi:hypothetical protein
MATRVPCEKCDKPMSEQAVVCPHCGARQAERDPLPEQREGDLVRGRYAKKPMTGLSKDEVSALIASDVRPAGEERGPRGLFAALVLPHRKTRGAWRAAEIALTVLGLPLVAGATLFVGTVRTVRRFHGARVGELTSLIVALGPGNFGLWVFLSLVGVEQPLPWLVAPSAAVVARALVRAAARRRTSTD